MNITGVPDDGSINILKVREDPYPIYIEKCSDNKFCFRDDQYTSWDPGGENFGFKELRHRIEPWLTSLFQSEHLSLLIGSGITHAIHYICKGEPAAGMGRGVDYIGDLSEYIREESDRYAKKGDRGNANIEDDLRAANELLRGLEILQDERAEDLKSKIKNILYDFSCSILQNEYSIATDETNREKAFNCLVSFLMSFASRTGTRDRLDIFTTNYDRILEIGSELAGIHLLDRFVGNITPIFRSSRLDIDMHYNPPGIRGEPRYLEGVARYTKLHGSVDWFQVGNAIRRVGLPFGASNVKPFLQAPGLNLQSSYNLMIYPNAAKDRETADYPYVELFRDLAASVCRPNSTMVVYGYGFGDDHINRVIKDMLTIPSTHLVIISRDLTQRMIDFTNSHSSQISLLIGPDLADLENLTNYFLPKSAIDKASRRMGDLIRQRFDHVSSQRED